MCVCVCVPDHSLLVPPHLQELYDMYMRELDERKLDRAMALDKVTTRHTIKVAPARQTQTKHYKCEDIKKVCVIDVNALFSRRALFPRSPSPVRLVTTCRTWTQTRRVCATCALITDEAKPKSADTLCRRFCPNLSCKRTSFFNVSLLEFTKD